MAIYNSLRKRYTGMALIWLLFVLLPANSLRAEALNAAVGVDANIDVKFYYLDVNINIESPYISGSVYIEFTPTKNNLSQFYLNLQSGLHNSLSVSGDGQSVSKSNNTIIIKLTRAFNIGETVKVVVGYQGVPQEANNTKGLVYETIGDQKVIASLSTPWLAHYWWPCKDGTEDKADSVYVDVTINNKTVDGVDYIAVSNGVLEETVEHDNNTTTFMWRHRHPIVTYYVMVAISNYQSFTNPYSSGGTSFPLIYYVFPDHLYTAQNGVRNLGKAMDLFRELYGEYPYMDEKYGMTQIGFYTAIENQTNTIINSMDGSWYYTMVHELSHNWFGGNITCSDWHHGWMNEGFAEYSEALYAERYEGTTSYKNKMTANEYWGGGTVYLDDISDPFNIFQGIIYYKGAWVLHMLRGYLGDEVFFDCVKRYATDSRFVGKNASTEDFRDLCEDISGKSLVTYFNQWIYDEYYPKYRYNFYSDLANSQAGITIVQKQASLNGWREVFEMPVKLKINFSDGTFVRETVFNNAQTQTFYFIYNKTISSIDFDPDKWILCEKSRDTGIIVPRPSGSDARDITSFTVPGQIGASEINTSNYSVSLSVAPGTDVTNLVSTIGVSPFATISPISGTARNFTNPVTYVVTAQNLTTRTWTVTITEGLSDANDITAFAIAGQIGQGIINATNHTITLTMPYGTNPASLIPNITISPNAQISPASGVGRDFTLPVAYNVIAQNSDSQLWMVTVVVALNSANDITSFVIPNQVGSSVINAINHTVNVVMPFGASRESLVPTIAVSQNATIDPLGGVGTDFTNSVVYTVTAQDGSEQNWQVNVTNQLNDQKDIVSFMISDQVGESIINAAQHTVSLMMPYGVSLNPLTPVIQVSPFATISPVSGLARNFSYTRSYTVTAQNLSTQVWNVTVSNAPNTANDITSLSISGQEGGSVINSENHTVAVTMPYGTNRSALTPMITVSESATLSPASGVSQNFTNAVDYTVRSQSGVSQVWRVTVTNAANTANDITSFVISGQVGSSVIDAVNHTVSVVMPYGVSRTLLAPMITVSESATLSPSSGVSQNFTNSVDYTVVSQSGVSQIWRVTVTNAANTANDITSFLISGQVSNSVINATNHTVSVVLPNGVSISDLTPTITVSELATISPASGVSQNFTNAVDYTVVSQSGVSQIWRVMVTNAANTANDITSFLISGQVGNSVINAVNHTVSVVMPYGVSRTLLAPTITVSESATLSPASGVNQNFTNAVDYTVRSQSGVAQIWRVTVTNAPNTANAITSFAIAEQVSSSVINAANHTVSVVMPYGVSRSALSPTIRVSESATLSPASGVSQNFTNAVDYTVVSQSGVSQIWRVTVINAANTANAITSFEIAGQVGGSVINAINHTVSVVMPYGVSRSALAPTITVSESATLSPASGVSQNFTNAVDYTVTSQSGVAQVWRVTVTNVANTANAITSFAIAGQVSSSDINAVNHTVSVVMPYGVSRTLLAPTITVSESATLSPASGVSQNFTNAVDYTVVSQSGVSQIWRVTVTNAANTANDITSFVISGQVSSSIINDVNHTVSVVMPYGVSRTLLAPTITVSESATLSPASGVSQNFNNAVDYTVISQSGVSQIWRVTVSNAANTAKDITSFVIAGQVGSTVINAANHTVSVVLSYGVSRTSLTPTITVSESATLSPASGVSQNFTNAVDYTVISQSGVSQIWRVTVSNAANTANDITSFVIAGQVGSSVINAINHTVSVVLLYGVSRTLLAPTITVSEFATLSPASGVNQNFTNPVDYTVVSQSGVSQIWRVTVSNAANTANDITSFVIYGQVGSSVIDAANHIVSVVLPNGVSISDLTPTITVSESATISPDSGVSQNFTNSVDYTVVSQSGVSQIWRVTVSNAANTANDITSFVISGQVGSSVINAVNHTVSVVMPYGVSRTLLAPTITVSESGTLSPASGVSQNFTNAVDYNVRSQSGVSQIWRVTVSNATNTANDISSFVISGQVSSSIINDVNHTVSVMMPYGVSRTLLAPTITVSESATLSPASGVSQNFTNSVDYTVISQSGVSQIWRVTVTNAANTANAITSFVISGQVGSSIINAVNHTVSVVMPYGVSRTLLAPTITVSESATLSPASGVSQNFNNAVDYTVISQSGVSQIWRVTVSNAANTANDITSFVISGQVGNSVINTVNHTVLVVMPYGVSRTLLAPTITVSESATLSPASGVSQNFTNAVDYTVVSQSGVAQVWRVTVTNAANTANEITSFVISGQVGSSVINAANHTVSVVMPYGVSRTLLAPTITVSESATLSPASGVNQNFTNAVDYTVISQSGVSQIWRVTVTNAANTANDITSFVISGQVGSSVIDAANHTISVVLPYGVSRTLLTPTITVSESATLSPASGVNQNFTNAVDYNVVSQSGVSQIWRVTVNNAANTANDITSFEIAGQVGSSVINAVNHTVSAVIPYGVSRSALTPTITVSESGTLSPASDVSQNFTNPVDYTVVSQSGVSQIWRVTVTNSPNTANAITSFSIVGQVSNSVINAVNHTVSVVMPYGVSRTSLTPTITVSESATLSPASGVSQNFTNAVDYTVISQSGVSQIWRVTVTNASNTANDITSFAISGQVVSSVINATNHTVSVVMPYGVSRSTLTPVIKVSESATISPAGGIATNFNAPVYYTVISQSGLQQGWVVNVVNALNEANEIVLFAIHGQVGVSDIQKDTHTVSVIMPYATDRRSLTPIITVSENATLSPASGLLGDFSNPVNYIVMSQSGVNQQWTVTVHVASNTANDILSFSIPGQVGSAAINLSNHTINVTMPYGVSRNGLVPTITVSAESRINPSSGIVQNFTNVQNYTVTSQSGASQIWTVRVINAASTANAITSFAIPGQVGQSVINAVSHSVMVNVPFETNKRALVPIIAISEFATINPMGGMATNFTNPVNYVVTSQSGVAQSWTVSVVANVNTGNDIVGFDIPNQIGTSVIDEQAHTVMVKMLAGTDLSALIPEIQVSEGASVFPGSNVTNHFNSPVTYVVTAEDGTPQAWLVSVVIESTLIQDEILTVMTVYPNPTNGLVTIESSFLPFDGIMVYSMDGTMISQAHFIPTRAYQFTFEWSQKGVFFIHIVTPKGRHIVKVLVRH